MGVLSQLGLGLAKTREGLLGSIRRLLPGSRKITPELCEELEAALLAADVGAACATWSGRRERRTRRPCGPS
jgi:signal recognition particle GTPase